MVERTSIKLVVDDHTFSIEIPNTNGPHCCRLQIFVGGDRPIAVATQDMPPGTGASLTNAAEQFATEAWRRHLPEYLEPPRWIQHYTSGSAPWMEVTFDVDIQGDLTSPSWVGVRPEALAEILGQPIDAGRGDTYIAPEPEPALKTTLRMISVAALPPTRPFRAKGCMPAVGTTRRRLWRRWFPIRSRSCCWYHGGDWPQVMDVVAALLGPTGEVQLVDEDWAGLVQQVVARTPPGSWLQEAAVSLVQDPLCVDSAGWVSGQHRGQGAIDAAARQILAELC